MKKKFGELLLERRLITAEQLADALSLQRRRGMRLGAALVARGHITEGQLVTELGAALGLKVVELGSMPVNPEVLKLVDQRFAADNELFAFGLRKERGGRRVVSVAMSDPLNMRIIDELGFMTNAQVEPVLARASDIDAAITRSYGLRSRGSEAYGRDAEGHDLLALDTADGEPTTTMTIMRQGLGAEEIIETETGRVLSPFVRGAGGALLENPEVKLPQDAPRTTRAEEVSALLLTDEVEDSTPVDARVGARTPEPPAARSGGAPGASGGAPGASGGAGARAELPGLRSGGGAPLAAASGGRSLAPPSYGTLAGVGVSPPPAASRAPAQALGFTAPPPIAGTEVAAAELAALGPAPSRSLPPSWPFEAAASPIALDLARDLAPIPPLASAASAIAPGGYPPARDGARGVGPTPVRPPVSHGSAASPYFDDALGALLDAAGGAVSVESMMRLERRLTTLVRILVKKGVLEEDELLEELGED